MDTPKPLGRERRVYAPRAARRLRGTPVAHTILTQVAKRIGGAHQCNAGEAPKIRDDSRASLKGKLVNESLGTEEYCGLPERLFTLSFPSCACAAQLLVLRDGKGR